MTRSQFDYNLSVSNSKSDFATPERLEKDNKFLRELERCGTFDKKEEALSFIETEYKADNGFLRDLESSGRIHPLGVAKLMDGINCLVFCKNAGISLPLDTDFKVFFIVAWNLKLLASYWRCPEKLKGGEGIDLEFLCGGLLNITKQCYQA